MHHPEQQIPKTSSRANLHLPSVSCSGLRCAPDTRQSFITNWISRPFRSHPDLRTLAFESDQDQSEVPISSGSPARLSKKTEQISDQPKHSSPWARGLGPLDAREVVEWNRRHLPHFKRISYILRGALYIAGWELIRSSEAAACLVIEEMDPVSRVYIIFPLAFVLTMLNVLALRRSVELDLERERGNRPGESTYNRLSMTDLLNNSLVVAAVTIVLFVEKLISDHPPPGGGV